MFYLRLLLKIKTNNGGQIIKDLAFQYLCYNKQLSNFALKFCHVRKKKGYECSKVGICIQLLVENVQ